jgi:hypothetical protein
MGQPSLINYFAHQTLSSITKKGMFSGEYVLFGEYLEQTQMLFEMSSALGYTYRDKIETFATLFSEEGKQKSVVDYMSTAAIERYKKYKPEHKNWFDFFFSTEALDITKRFQDAKILPTGEWFNPKVYKSKVPHKLAMVLLPTLSAEGIAFGYKYPELVEKFFSFIFKADEWNVAFKAGLDIGSEPPKTITLSTMQKEVKSLIKPIVEKYHPELAQSLDLNN